MKATFPFPDFPNYFGLNDWQIKALQFGLGSVLLGTTGGLSFGGITALMKGIDETAEGRAHLRKSFKLFSLAGLVYGTVGGSLMIVRECDDYYTRMAAGCSAGLSLGIYGRSLPVSCVGCVSLAALAAFSRFFDEQSMEAGNSEFLKKLLEPLPREAEKWTRSSK